MTQTLMVNPGTLMDTLVGRRFLGGEVKPYSTDPDYAAEVCQELMRRGYDLDFEEDEVAILDCTLKRGRAVVAHVRGRTYEETVCRVALLLINVDSP
jgi:hypothetical protein